jgi:peptidoglycan/LPS O-acetylase OafA/YrhL
MILLGPIARAGAWVFLKGSPYQELSMFPMVSDSLAVGCLLAKMGSWLEARRWYLQLFRPGCSVGLLALILVLNRYMSYGAVFVLGTSAINFSLAILIHRSVCCPHDWLGQALNWKPVVFIGVLSYSLYLWQELFLNRYSTAWVCAFPQNLVLAVAAAMGSYFLLEKPLLTLRHRLRA